MNVRVKVLVSITELGIKKHQNPFLHAASKKWSVDLAYVIRW